jgi:hypothetical protein
VSADHVELHCGRCGRAFQADSRLLIHHLCRPFQLLDAVLLWFFTFGVWPVADPGHALHTATSVIDVCVHVTAFIWLCHRWRIVRRNRP